MKSEKNKAKEYVIVLISILIITDLAIFLNIPFLRQIFSFLFITIIPGLLLIQILNLNKLSFLEKFILSWGLSISFLMFFGLALNNLSLAIGYLTPLSINSLLISLNIATFILAFIGYKMNKDLTFSLPDFNLSTSEKAFFIVPVLFPALTIFGTYIMNTTNNNSILIFLSFLIPVYVAFMCFFDHKIPDRMYPFTIFMISLSILLMLSLTSFHLVGRDIHQEFNLFRRTWDNMHWQILSVNNPLDACLSISLLPTIYQAFLNVNPEHLFKVLYPLIYSVTPIIVYIISRKYVKDSYAFLAAIFFMFQHIFIDTTMTSRTSVAVLFFALAMFVLFKDEIDPVKKRLLFIVFLASTIISHYSTTYIFLFILIGAFVGMELLSKKYISARKSISLIMVFFFFASIFFWYSQVTETSFNIGVGFLEKTFFNLNRFFLMESRAGGGVSALLGEDIMLKGLPHILEFVFTWLTFILIGMGVFTVIRNYRSMVSFSVKDNQTGKPNHLKTKFEPDYFVIALICSALLVAMVALPYVSQGYDMGRLYAVCLTILSVFFVIGAITLSRLSLKKEALAKNQKSRGKTQIKPFFKDGSFSKEISTEKGGDVRVYLIILLVLIPYFLCVTGVTYQMFGYPRAVTLNAAGEVSDWIYIHDQDIIGAKWVGNYGICGPKGGLKLYSDGFGNMRVALAYDVKNRPSVSTSFFMDNETVNDGYIYLRYANVVEEKVYPQEKSYNFVNLTIYSHLFIGKSKIYNNGGAEIYK
ncbi:MAG: DUF2206 domain-containing protein [Halobacteriota archaeon]